MISTGGLVKGSDDCIFYGDTEQSSTYKCRIQVDGAGMVQVETTHCMQKEAGLLNTCMQLSEHLREWDFTCTIQIPITHRMECFFFNQNRR